MAEWISDFLRNIDISMLGSAASIASLLISFIVLYQVGLIKERFLNYALNQKHVEFLEDFLIDMKKTNKYSPLPRGMKMDFKRAIEELIFWLKRDFYQRYKHRKLIKSLKKLTMTIESDPKCTKGFVIRRVEVLILTLKEKPGLAYATKQI